MLKATTTLLTLNSCVNFIVLVWIKKIFFLCWLQWFIQVVKLLDHFSLSVGKHILDLGMVKTMKLHGEQYNRDADACILMYSILLPVLVHV